MHFDDNAGEVVRIVQTHGRLAGKRSRKSCHPSRSVSVITIGVVFFLSALNRVLYWMIDKIACIESGSSGWRSLKIDFNWIESSVSFFFCTSKNLVDRFLLWTCTQWKWCLFAQNVLMVACVLCPVKRIQYTACNKWLRVQTSITQRLALNNIPFDQTCISHTHTILQILDFSAFQFVAAHFNRIWWPIIVVRVYLMRQKRHFLWPAIYATQYYWKLNVCIWKQLIKRVPFLHV